MAWTQAQLDNLEAAIAEGALVVQYEDRKVTYQSLGDMLKLRKMMRVALGLEGSARILKPSAFSKGLRPGPVTRGQS